MFHVSSFTKDLSRVLVNSAFFLILLATLSPVVRADTVSNFGQWRNFNSFSKIAYVAGTVDTFLSPLKVPDKHERFKKQFDLCLKDFHITLSEIVSMVDNFYLNSKNWAYSPQEAIKYQLINGHCFQYVADNR